MRSRQWLVGYWLGSGIIGENSVCDTITDHSALYYAWVSVSFCVCGDCDTPACCSVMIPVDTTIPLSPGFWEDGGWR